MKVIAIINNLVRMLCTVLLILMTGLVIFQVISRKFLGISVAEVEEIARYCMIWTGLLGAAVGIYTKGHVAVELVRDKLPPKLKKAAILFSYVVMALFFMILVVFGAKLSNQAMTQTSTSMPFLKMGFIMCVVPMAGALGIINLFALVVQELRSLTKPIVIDKDVSERS